MVKDRLAELKSKSKYANYNQDDAVQIVVQLSKSQEEIFQNLEKLEADLGDEICRVGVLFRIKNTQFLVIRDDYLNVYREHEEFISYYEQRIMSLMKLEAKAMNYNITDDEALEQLNENQMSPFVANLLEETERERQKLRDMMTRHSQLEALEKSLMEVRDITTSPSPVGAFEDQDAPDSSNTVSYSLPGWSLGTLSRHRWNTTTAA
uniref:Uncharacterized protein n=1 Tax=Anopheles farauti TaxID=69004 RepID=A0A182Q384_9DIPT